MNHELAKKLKEAGFPQGHYQKAFDEVKEHPERHDAYAHAYGVKSLEEIAYPPTLPELIEACGEGFGSLTRDRGLWLALPKEAHELGVILDPKNGTYGKTPEEAVANLYLALKNLTIPPK